jgi:hypothetical protein
LRPPVTSKTTIAQIITDYLPADLLSKRFYEYHDPVSKTPVFCESGKQFGDGAVIDGAADLSFLINPGAKKRGNGHLEETPDECD